MSKFRTIVENIINEVTRKSLKEEELYQQEIDNHVQDDYLDSWEEREKLKNKRDHYNDFLNNVRYRGHDLIDVPDELKDYDICLKAVKNDPLALEFVPERFKDYNLCLAAVKNHGFKKCGFQMCKKILSLIPKKLKDHNMCFEAVKNEGLALELIPEELKDYDICLEAVKNDPRVWRDIPEQFKDYNFCLEVVKIHGDMLKYVPDELKDYDMCLEAAKKSKIALYYYTPKQFIKKIEQELKI